MKLIIGLGNPGEKYTLTRHNIGFLFLDYIKNSYNISGDFEFQAKFQAEILETHIEGEKYLFIKPQTFMNLSGESVLKLMSFYKIEKKDILVIFDDISLEVGKSRFRAKGSSGGQNGVKNIISKIGEDFSRIKIGIGLDQRWDVADWVLSKISQEELGEYNQKIFPEALQLLKKEFINK